MSEPKTGDVETTTVERTGKPPLRFKADRACWSDSSKTVKNNNRWTVVRIWKTKGGRYVASVSNYTCWEGEHDYHDANTFTTPAEVITWLSRCDEEGNGRLGRISQGAIEEACKDDPEFTKAFVEEVE